MKVKAEITVTILPNVLDPQGQAIKKVLTSKGISQVSSLKQGKYIEMYLDVSSKEEAEEITEKVSKELLSCSTLESYTWEIKEVK